jgi:hypothetical protein
MNRREKQLAAAQVTARNRQDLLTLQAVGRVLRFVLNRGCKSATGNRKS